MSKDWIILLVLSLITSFAWIGFEIHRAATQPAIPEVKTGVIEPLDPTLNQKVLNMLRSTEKERPFEN